MVATHGIDRQEQKIEAMADLVSGLHGEINRQSLKGVFRLGIKEALARQGYGNWKEVADKPVVVRKNFFSELLDASMAHLLKIGFPEALEKDARTALTRENDKFLRS